MYEVRRGYLREVIAALPAGAEIVSVVPLLTRKPGTMEMEVDLVVKLADSAQPGPAKTPTVRRSTTAARTTTATPRKKSSA